MIRLFNNCEGDWHDRDRAGTFSDPSGVGAAVGLAAPGPVEKILCRLTRRTPDVPLRSDGLIRLDSNENPYGPSAKVAKAIRSRPAW